MSTLQYEKLEPTIKKHVHTCVAACLAEVATSLRATAQQIENIGSGLGSDVAAPPAPVKVSPAPTEAAPAAKPYVAKGCIKPGCSKDSKGPRYRYCCEKHRTAAPEWIGYWQALARGEKPAKPQSKVKPAKGVTITKAQVTKAATKKASPAKKSAKANGAAETSEA